MRKLEGVYIVDTLDNIGAYAGISGNFAKAVAEIGRGKLHDYQPGRNTLDGENLWVNFDRPLLVNPKDRKAELHHRYFDIQIPFADETFGVARFDPSAAGSFDEEKDFGLYDQELEWIDLQSGEFAIFYPRTCLHAPACTRGEPHASEKLIFKVRA